MARFTLRQLEIFAQVVESGSFYACAKALGVSQVAITDHVRQLEKRLGRILFARQVGGPSTLTVEGEAAFAVVRRILDDVALLEGGQPLPEAEAPVKPAAPPIAEVTTPIPEAAPPAAPAPIIPASSLMLATHPSLLSHFQEALADFQGAHPDVELDVDLDCYVVDDVQRAMTAGRVDIACYYALTAPAEFPSDYLWSERLSLFVGEAHPLARRHEVVREDVDGVPVVLLSRTNPLRALIQGALDEAGLENSPVALESDDYGRILEQVRMGAGLFAVFGPPARDFGQQRGVHRLPYIDPLPPVEVRRTLRLGRNTPAAAEELFEALVLQA